MGLECKWLPKRILLPDDDWSNYPAYEEKLYQIFLKEIYNHIDFYKSKPVHMRRAPEWNNKHESFYHIICDKTKDKDNLWFPNKERASRLKWGKAIIEHDPCFESCCNCAGLYSWDTVDQNGKRKIHKILFKEKKYLVILEERSDYWLYITSYYIDGSRKLRELTKEYHDIKAKNALHS